MNLLTPPEITERAVENGCAKIELCRHGRGRFAVMTIIAGAFIALGGLLSIITGQGMPGVSAQAPAVGRLLAGLVFPIGLLLIVTLGGELFTGNNAMLIPVLTRRRCTPGDVVANWTMVWIGNFVGALVFVALFVIGGGTLDAEPWHTATANIATAKVELQWLTVLCRGIGANWCVCLAVWLAMAGKTLVDKVLACWIPVGAFVILGWEHCVANMFFIPAGMACGADISIGQMMVNNLLPATLGNIIGGALFVGLPYALTSRPK